MKNNIILLLIIILSLFSCTTTNKIFINEDPFRNQTTLKLNQVLKGYSDERVRPDHGFADYYVSFKHFFASDEKEAGNTVYHMDVKLSTRVRAYEVEPVIYLSLDGQLLELEAKDKISKMYQQGSSSSTSSTSSSTSEDPDDENKEIVETTTTYTTSSSHNTYQLMQLRFEPDINILEKISAARKVKFRLYIENEIIDMPLRCKNRRKFEAYVKKIKNAKDKSLLKAGS